MFTQFLYGVPYHMSQAYPGLYVLGSDGSSLQTGRVIDEWYCAPYNMRNVHKEKIMRLMGQKPDDFDFHHVVEGQHIADITSLPDLELYYDKYIPTVLIDKKEHKKCFDAALHIKEFRQVYTRSESKAPRKAVREKQSVELARSRGGRMELYMRIDLMKQFYFEVYKSYPHLRKIASNILLYYRSRL